MGKLPWRLLRSSLQLSCCLLAASAFLLMAYQETGFSENLRLAKTMQDFSQLGLLAAALVPVCVEELTGEERKTPPGSSGR